MAMSRSLGGTAFTTLLPIAISPDVMFSSPASMRNKVDLPQPEGPTSTTNSPSSIGIDTPCRTSKLPNDFRTSRICTDDINSLRSRNNAPQPWPAVLLLLVRVLPDFFGNVVGSKVVKIGPCGRDCEPGIAVPNIENGAQNSGE